MLHRVLQSEAGRTIHQAGSSSVRNLNLKTDISSVHALLFTSIHVIMLQVSNSAWHSVDII